MKITDLINYSQKPKLYEPGNAIMWTDPYISKQLLAVHLSDQTDLASRKTETINTTVEWILSHSGSEKLKIIDLGCGPGLYSEKLTQKGHSVTGIDFSANSIEYATSEAKRKNLEITYVCQDYTELEFPENHFDLVLLIYTDFCPLLPEQREKLLHSIKKVLKPEGSFIFDFSNDLNFHKKTGPISWEITEKGFWKDGPYLVLSNSFLYENEKVVLYQNIIIDETDKINLYRFWHHYFSTSDISQLLRKHGFEDISFHDKVIPGGDGYDSEDITFCVAVNQAATI
jgi:SAM-dependent methyltransferase